MPQFRQLFPTTVSRVGLVLLCLGLIGALGYIDYYSGYEQSILLFYLIPVSLGVWYAGLIYGLVFSLLSIAAWILADVAAGVPTVGTWNLATALAAYVVFTILLSKLHTLLNELDQRVRDRTMALRREMAERERLDREIAVVADRERRRLGQELHDSLCQHLTGTALTAQTLRENLAMSSAPEVAEADKVVRYIEEGIDLTRNLARGFFSPELDAEGLIVALQGLAENMAERFQIACKIDIDETVRVSDSTVATQLYRIAQEAVMNAIKHADAQQVDIRLRRDGEDLTLEIIDDGIGFPERLPQPEGLGLRLMSHGAALIGANFRVERTSARGTSVVCKLRSGGEPNKNVHEPKN